MSDEQKAEMLSWVMTFFIIIVGFLMIVGLLIFVEIKQEGVPDSRRFGHNDFNNFNQEPFSIVVDEDIYVPEKLTGKYTKHGRLILPKSERGW
jgi:predicted Abi (CAAX) family protease